jgi:hypothetical protein
MSVQISQNALAFLKVQGAKVPPEGPIAIPIPLDFTATTDYSLNLQNIISRGFISMVQAVFVDNSANSAAITLQFDNTSQNITLQAGEQAYLNVLCQNPAVMDFVSTGGVAGITVWLLNFPVVNCVWAANASSGPSATPQIVTYSGGVTHPELVANLTVTGNAANTTAALITGAPGYYITGVSLQLTSNATLTAGTDLQVTLTDSSTGAVATLNLSPATGLFGAILGFFWNNKVAASNLVLTFSTSLATGHLYYTLNYGQSSFVG